MDEIVLPLDYGAREGAISEHSSSVNPSILVLDTLPEPILRLVVEFTICVSDNCLSLSGLLII